jgi:hypothetical protein
MQTLRGDHAKRSLMADLRPGLFCPRILQSQKLPLRFGLTAHNDTIICVLVNFLPPAKIELLAFHRFALLYFSG